MVTRTNDYTGVGLLVVIYPFQEISRICDWLSENPPC